MLKRLSTLLLALVAVGLLPQSAMADNDQITVKVGVVNTKGAPEPKIHVKVPIGAKSDGAKLTIDITGLEEAKPVFFNLNPDKSSFTRKKTDSKGALHTVIELPYGIEPGTHELLARTVFGKDATSASYTATLIYVNSEGKLTNSDGSQPEGTQKVTVLPPNSADGFADAPEFSYSTGILVSEPQLRIHQGLLPSIEIGVTIKNATSYPQTFAARIALESVLGFGISTPYYVELSAMAPGESRTVLLEARNLPPVVVYNIHTELELPATFRSDEPVQTTHSSVVTVWPTTVVGMALVVVFGAMTTLLLRKRQSKVGAQ